MFLIQIISLQSKVSQRALDILCADVGSCADDVQSLVAEELWPCDGSERIRKKSFIDITYPKDF